MYDFVKNYLLNGMYGYALLGIYSLTISPFVTRFIDYGEENKFVAIFGFVMLIAEFFAINFKLRMVRMRSEQKRIAYKKETGIDIIPSVGPGVFFAFCMRMVFHVAILMVGMTALGYPCTEQLMSVQGQVVLIIWVFADIFGFTYIYFKTGFYTDPPRSRQELREDLQDEEEWDKANAELTSSEKYFRMEIVADVILQIYTLMLFTAFWKYINDMGIDVLRTSFKGNETAVEAAFRLFPMLFAMVILGLMPMRIAYWIEDSMEAFTGKEKLGMWIMFFIVAFFTCSPSIIKFVTLFILGLPDVAGESSAGYIGYIFSVALFVALLLVQIFVFGRKQQTVVQK